MHKNELLADENLISVDKIMPFIDTLERLPIVKSNIDNVYKLTMRECNHCFHKYLLESRVWGFNGMYLGPTIEVKPYMPISVLWRNNLPEKHLFQVDHRIHGAGMNVPDVRTVVHVHGAKTYDIYDGYPERWFLPGDEIIYQYPNEQDAATLWYHDHALGITRLNIYAGLSGFYLINNYERDEKLGFPVGKYDIPLIIQDKNFDTFGQIVYPESFEPEVYGDFNVVNGKIWPYFEVEAKPYRFRLLNASNARFYNLTLGDLPFYQIATEHGILENFETLKNILLAPSERIEVVVDFSKIPGERIELMNDAPAPYPAGESPSGRLANVMQFRVKNKNEIKFFGLTNYNNDFKDNILEESATVERFFTLDSSTDRQTGLLIHQLNKKMWDDPEITQVKLNDVENWCFINLTEDSHPIHLHLVKFIIVGRRPFNVEHFNETNEIAFTGDLKSSEPYEKSFKDVVVVNPGEVATIKVKFEGYKGRYVWHCHMLEHEDFEMMLPYDVV